MNFINPDARAYRDFTRNGLTSLDPSPYPPGTSNDRRWTRAMRDFEAKQHRSISHDRQSPSHHSHG